jgi:large subunit ribosomal protein L25
MATQHIKFSADIREKAGKGVARALRRENKIPGVIYGDGKAPVMISMSAKDANLEYQKGHMFTNLSDIEAGGEKFLTLARDIQVHPVKETVEHIDFLRVSPKTKIDVEVPAHFINEEDAPFSKRGGILNIVRHEISLTCTATAIPESIEVDLTPYEVGDAIKLSDVTLPEGTKSAIDRDLTIATIAAPKTAEQEAAEEAEADADIEAGAEGDEASAEDSSEEKSEE